MSRFALSFASVLILAAATPAPGITFDLTFPAGATNPNDPTGAGLQAIAQEAADRWSDIIEDNYTMKLNVSYYTNDGAGNGPCGNGVQTACAPIVSTNATQTRTLEGNLFVFANRNWYIDPTPGDDDEFDMVQTQYIDLSTAQQTAGYAGMMIERLLEIGMRGSSNGSDPNAGGGFDMLGTMLHEFGHHLGVTNQFLAATNETADDDYDLPASLLGGRNMDVLAAAGSEFHFIDSFPLLSNVGVGIGLRRLPTAADVLATAAVSGWSQIDLQRQDFLVGTSWGTASAWVGNQVPGSADAAFIRGGFNDLIGTGDVLLDQNDSVASLFISRSSNLRTGSNRLDVGGATTIDFGGDFPFSQIFVETGGELETGDLVISGGELDMEGGLADIQNSVIITKQSSGGNITGHGTVDVQNSLNNNGLISATDDAELRFTSNNSANVFRIDGTLGQGVVRANSGDLVFEANIDPTFAGEMQVGAGHFIEINNDWRLAPAGSLELDGSTTEEAIVRGAAIELEGTVDVDQRARLVAAVRIDPSADINLPDADDRLTLGSVRADAVTYNGGSISGDGLLVQNGDAVVQAGATQTIGVDQFDWDGGTASSTTLLSGSRLILNSSALTDAMDGVVTLSDAHLTVNTAAAWPMRDRIDFASGTSTLDGATLDLVETGSLNFLAGTGVVDTDADIAGDVTVAADAQFNGAVDLAATSSVTVSQSGVLRLEGDTVYRGGVVTGTGDIEQNDRGVVAADQTIDLTGTFDWDGATNDSEFLVNSGRSLTLNVGRINNGSNVYRGALTLRGGLVTVNVAADLWNLFGTLNLEPGKGGESAILLGDAVDIVGDVNASGEVTHFISAPSRFLSAGSSLTVQSGTTVHFNAPVEFTNGSHVGFGTIAVNDSGSLSGGIVNIDRFEVGGSASFDLEGGELRADVVDPSTGAFRFVGGRLATALYSGDLVNDGGTLAPGPSTLSADLTVIDGDYIQTNEGVLEIQLGGVQTDQLKVTSRASLDGVLDVSLLGAFTPSLGDTFNIVSSNGLSGVFAQLLLPVLDAGLDWEIIYDSFDATLEVVSSILPGDYNGDGLVDSIDYAVWRENLGQRIILPGDTTPGAVTSEDFGVWQANYGAIAASSLSSPPARLASVPEPAAGLLLLIAALMVVGRRR